ncbi:hypothetical protein AACH06_25520 [Ideonella sp. DXS29W]|uniref:Uncharacterized protein n=1 Tax=Ideonella lacteola TaxID=2984193 RepID=A0ABU9BZC1_9BURK
MLSESLKPIGFGTFEQEPWEDFRARLSIPADGPASQFYRQVVYDHFVHFNEHYPDFVLSDYEFKDLLLTAQQARDQIRFFRGDTLDNWGMQYDEFEARNHDYVIYQSMAKAKTFPFPPILLDASRLSGTGWRECGKPLHLVEGTHRVSYLRRMLARQIVTPDSKHSFVLLKPK